MRSAGPYTSPPPKTRRWLRIVIVLVLLMIVVPVGLLWYGVSAKPDYWQPIDRTRPDAREAAERFEQAMSAQVRQMPAPVTQTPAPVTPAPAERPEWTVEVTQEQLNSWLAVRLTEWGANRSIDPRMLDRMSRSMVNVDVDAVEVAVPFEQAGVSSIVRLRYKPVLGEDKRVRLVLQDAHAGLIPVPITTVFAGILAYVPQGQPGELESLRRKIQALDLLIPLADGRTVSVVGMQLRPGKLLLTCQVHRG